MSPKLTILHMTHQYWLTKAFIEATKPGTEKNWTIIDESLNVAWRAQRKFEKTMEEEHNPTTECEDCQKELIGGSEDHIRALESYGVRPMILCDDCFRIKIKQERGNHD